MTTNQMTTHALLWESFLTDICKTAPLCKKCGSTENLRYEDLGKEDPSNMLCEQCLFAEIYEREKLEFKNTKLQALIQAGRCLVAETDPDEEGMRNPPSVEAVDALKAALPPREPLA